jgi:GAF domain-containing protein
MLNWMRRFLAAPVFEDEDKTRTASMLNLILLSTLALSLMVIIATPITFPDPVPSLLATGALALLQLGALFLMRHGRVQLASGLFSSALWVIVTLWAFFAGGVRSSGFTTYILIILIAGLLWGGHAGIIFASLSVVAGVGILYAEISGVLPPPFVSVTSASTFMTQTVHFILTAVLLYLATRNIYDALERARRNERAQAEANRELQALRASLEQRVADRTRGLQTAAKVARATTSVLDPDQLLHQVVNLVREQFHLYYVGLFLLDEERRFAVLQAGTGEAGQQMLAQRHRLEVGGDSMIGWCVANAEARIALDVGEEAIRFDNPLLPYTRSEIALPLRSRGRVIGAMTVQSVEEAAFDEADIAVMQTMADQVAVAIDNAVLFAEAQAALEEAEVTHQRYLGQTWAEYTRGRAVSGYERTDVGMVPLGEEALPQIQQAMAEHRPVVWTGDPSIGSGQALRQAHDEARDDAGSGHGGDTDLSPSALVAPIMLRGQPIGALGFRGEVRQWSDDDIALAEAIAEQLALAADNLRLLDETQRRAARERLTGEVTARMRETLDVDTVLQTAAREMREALGLEEVEVRMGTGPANEAPNSVEQSEAYRDRKGE